MIPKYFGNDSFTYTASDGEAESESATVYISVLGVNDNPTSSDMTVEVNSSPYQIDFSEAIYDADGDELTILTVPPSQGEILNTLFGGTLSPIGGLLYEYTPPEPIPDADFMLYKALMAFQRLDYLW